MGNSEFPGGLVAEMVLVSPTGDYAAAIVGGQRRLVVGKFEKDGQLRLDQVIASGVMDAAISPAGGAIMFANNADLVFWDFAARKVTFSKTMGGPIDELTFGSVSEVAVALTDRLSIVKIASLTQYQIPFERSDIGGLAFDSDAGWLAVSERDGSIGLVDVASRSLRAVLTTGNERPTDEYGSLTSPDPAYRASVLPSKLSIAVPGKFGLALLSTDPAVWRRTVCSAVDDPDTRGRAQSYLVAAGLDSTPCKS